MNSEDSEFSDYKCFGGLHVYFRFMARKVSSASLLILLQLAIWPEIVSFCPPGLLILATKKSKYTCNWRKHLSDTFFTMKKPGRPRQRPARQQ